MDPRWSATKLRRLSSFHDDSSASGPCSSPSWREPYWPADKRPLQRSPKTYPRRFRPVDGPSNLPRQESRRPHRVTSAAESKLVRRIWALLSAPLTGARRSTVDFDASCRCSLVLRSESVRCRASELVTRGSWKGKNAQRRERNSS